jgi:hypothetical protein
MPPRLSKRQQREKEEMEALAASPTSQSRIHQNQKSPIIKDNAGSVDEDSDKASDHEPKLSVGPVKSAFALVSVMDLCGKGIALTEREPGGTILCDAFVIMLY